MVTKEEYDNACARVYELIHGSDEPIEPDSSEDVEIDLLYELICEYEKQQYDENRDRG